jgi:tRNA pseudouridine55 synthase
MNCVLVIDKPAGLTSHDVVNRMRRILGEKSVGHLGTLDPMATGVLPLVTGGLTRLAQFYAKSEKTYEGVIRFGFATDTYDATGDAVGPVQEVELTLERVREVASRFQGAIEQMPPPFSAKKIQGVPAYKLARKHQNVPLKSVQVEIKELEIVGIEGCEATFRARVGSGTYMRSVAHDIGQMLGCGAHLAALRRSRVAEFEIASSHTLEAVHSAVKAGRIEELTIHPRLVLPHLPCVTANQEMSTRIRNGQTVNLPELSRAPLVKVFYGQSELLAIASRIAGTLFHAKIVFSAQEQLARH